MAVSQAPHSPDVDLGSLEFWGRPAQERDLYFAQLRCDAPISQHERPEDIMGMPEQERHSYWAIVRHEDIRRISRDPRTFCSAQGTPVQAQPRIAHLWSMAVTLRPGCSRTWGGACLLSVR